MQYISKQWSDDISNNILIYSMRKHCWDESRSSHGFNLTKEVNGIQKLKCCAVLLLWTISWPPSILNVIKGTLKSDLKTSWWTIKLWEGDLNDSIIWDKCKSIIRLQEWYCKGNWEIRKNLCYIYKIIYLINTWRRKKGKFGIRAFRVKKITGN